MEPEEVSFLYSQESATGLCPEPDESSPRHLPLRFILIFFPFPPSNAVWILCLFYIVLHPSFSMLSPEREEYKLWSFSLCTFLHSLTTFISFSPEILLSALFSHILDLCSSF
jgi:hypothetical protein